MKPERTASRAQVNFVRQEEGLEEVFETTCGFQYPALMFHAADRIVARVCMALAFAILVAATANAQAVPGSDRLRAQTTRPTIIYFVLHAHVDPTEPTFPLSAEGRRRADALTRTVSAVAFSHVFSSHTTRAREMVDAVAQVRNLVVRQLPAPGTTIHGSLVSDTTPSTVAIAPLVQALRELPEGSNVLVGLNSDNVYAVLNGLGVPVATPEQPCTGRSPCVPCLTNACITPSYDQLWILILDPRRTVPALIELRYGAPFLK